MIALGNNHANEAHLIAPLEAEEQSRQNLDGGVTDGRHMLPRLQLDGLKLIQLFHKNLIKSNRLKNKGGNNREQERKEDKEEECLGNEAVGERSVIREIWFVFVAAGEDGEGVELDDDVSFTEFGGPNSG